MKMYRFLMEYRHALWAILIFIVSIVRYTHGQEDEAECGKRFFPRNIRPVTDLSHSTGYENPQLASREDFPWHVGVFRRPFKFNSFVYECGGTLINGEDGEVLVLTSAKCLTEDFNSTRAIKDLNNLRVVIAPRSSNYNRNTEEFGSQKFGVKRIEINPLYEVKGHDADAAMIQLSGRVSLGKYAFPACLPPKNTPKMGVVHGMVGEISGFGWDSRRNVTESLRFATYPISTATLCQENRGVKVNDFLEMCAGYQKDSTACQADYGGGLVFQHPGNDGRFYIQGILTNIDTSPITEDGYCENFNIFQRVGPFLEWIKATRKEMSIKETDIDSQKPKPTPGGPLNQVPGITDFPTSKYAKIARDFHNHFRAIHNAPPVRLVESLQRSAQKLAIELVEEETLELPEKAPFSTNTYLIPTYVTAQEAVRAAVQYWYRGFTNYNRDSPRPSAFTQMVWKSSTQIGVGVATNGKKTAVVVNYAPKGNNFYESNRAYERTRPFSENVNVIPKGY